MENKGLFILHNHYHCCWCPGDWGMEQGISSHGIELVIVENAVLATKEIRRFKGNMESPFLHQNTLYRDWLKFSKYKIYGTVLLASFSFHISQTDNSRGWDSYFRIWPWKIQGQGHGGDQRLRPRDWSSVKSTYFLFISCHLDEPFLRYGKYSVWPWGKHIQIQ